MRQFLDQARRDFSDEAPHGSTAKYFLLTVPIFLSALLYVGLSMAFAWWWAAAAAVVWLIGAMGSAWVTWFHDWQ